MIWDGKDNHGKQLGGGEYTIFIEAAREHGTYQSIRKQVTLIGQAVQRGTQGQCRDQIRLDRVSPQGSGKVAHPTLPCSANAHSLRRKLAIRFAKLMRWLHIYLSMFGLAAVLFFSVTGITLNHPDWFFGQVERQREAEGQIDLNWLQPRCRHVRAGRSPVAELEVAKLEVVEHLRTTHDPRGPGGFSGGRERMHGVVQGPRLRGRRVHRPRVGPLPADRVDHGFIAVINDLHKGRDTGRGLVGGHRRLGRAHDR